MTTDRDLIAEGREKLSAAMPAPWTISPYLDTWEVRDSGDVLRADRCGLPDAELIVWARNNLPAMLDELEAQRARVDELAAQRDPADEVLVEGSWFHPADMPKVLGNYMRAASDYACEAKDMYVRLEKLRAERAEELAAIAAKQQRDAARFERVNRLITRWESNDHLGDTDPVFVSAVSRGFAAALRKALETPDAP